MKMWKKSFSVEFQWAFWTNILNCFIFLCFFQVFTSLTNSVTIALLVDSPLPGSRHWTNTCSLTVQVLFLATDVICAARNMLLLHRFRWMLQNNAVLCIKCIYASWLQCSANDKTFCLVNCKFYMILQWQWNRRSSNLSWKFIELFLIACHDIWDSY
jgi:hypothetical protein